VKRFDVIVVGSGSSGGRARLAPVGGPRLRGAPARGGAGLPGRGADSALFVVSGERSWVPAGIPELDWNFWDEPLPVWASGAAPAWEAGRRLIDGERHRRRPRARRSTTTAGRATATLASAGMTCALTSCDSRTTPSSATSRTTGAAADPHPSLPALRLVPGPPRVLRGVPRPRPTRGARPERPGQPASAQSGLGHTTGL
jgi:hypothetical protein